MVNYLRLMEDVNRAFRKEFGYLANPLDYPVAIERIIEDCTDMLEEEANDHNDIGGTSDDDTTEKA